MYTIVGDRESDIYELFLAYQEGEFGKNCNVLIRAGQNRRVVDEKHGLLFSAIEHWPKRGEYKLEVEGTHKRRKRKASIDIRFGKIKTRHTWIKSRRVREHC